MPDKCVVPTCRGNYKNDPKVFIFISSDPDLKQKWIQSIKRDLKVSLSFF